uniref:ATP synthase CF1 epsilon subunit n=1 Tax=Haramonas pauciplastida TaxID=478668 RepID=UPI0021154859|nr:ATP synthase CF1 epsilon subunit [Haramonas pauciplastida]UTE95012.1 ATP synthase CF1 epsilon subunit [Haramonas pauciplastida]
MLINVQVMTQLDRFWIGDAEQVIFPGERGYATILPGFFNCLDLVENGLIVMDTPDKKQVPLIVFGGFLLTADDNALFFVHEVQDKVTGTLAEKRLQFQEAFDELMKSSERQEQLLTKIEKLSLEIKFLMVMEDQNFFKY